ncbi:MAG: Yip1 family protein [Candidatus Aenigmatarchaeota archaeon]
MEEVFGKKSNLNVFQKIVYSLLKPESFFKEIKNEPFSATFLYLLFISFISLVLQTILFLIGVSFYQDAAIEVFFGDFIIDILLSFIGAGVFHIFAKILGGRSNYNGTFQAYVYGFTPAILLGWIPYIGIIGLIYGVYIFVRGISFIHEISMSKAFFVWFIPILILVIIVGIIILILGVAVISYLAGLYNTNPELLESFKTTGEIFKILKA